MMMFDGEDYYYGDDYGYVDDDDGDENKRLFLYVRPTMKTALVQMIIYLVVMMEVIHTGPIILGASRPLLALIY